MPVDLLTRRFVRLRAEDRCEYCRLSQAYSWTKHHIEHIVARQHGGSDHSDNLALACHRCNLFKGTNLAAIDPVTGETVALFHPRRDVWNDHFRIDGIVIEGTTAIGRAAVRLLAMNETIRLDLRREFPL